MTELGFAPCATCRHLARQSRQPSQAAETPRRSAAVLFGLHLLTEHAYRDRGLPIPEPTPATCQECRELLALPPVDAPAACTTRDEVVLQHLLSHLLPQIPDLPPPAAAAGDS